jgi:glutaredoxin
MTRLALYHFVGCPFCTMVRREIDQLDLDVELRDIHESSARRNELVEATGRGTVPCLRVESDGGEVRWMHESARIGEYLRGHAVA